MSNCDEIMKIVVKFKKEFPKVIFIVVNGGFYNVYGKDAIIIGYIQNYKVYNIECDMDGKNIKIPKAGFPAMALESVIEILDKKRISYTIKKASSTSLLDCQRKMYKNENYDRMYDTSRKYLDSKQKINEITIDDDNNSGEEYEITRLLNAHFKEKGMSIILDKILVLINEFKKENANNSS